MFIAVCKRSKSIAQSSTETEFYCLAEAYKELLWIQFFIGESNEDILCKEIFQDNTSTINMVSHEGISERSEYIDAKFHFVMKLKAEGKAEFPHSISAQMYADTFTKDLSDDVYTRHVAVMQGFTPDA